MAWAAERSLAAIAAAQAADGVDTSQVSDLDLACWILSILEGAADEKDAKEAALPTKRPQPAPSPATPKVIPPPNGPDSEVEATPGS